MLIPIIAFHEAAHAWAATQLGDDTPRYAGRLTLNPMPHLDLFGSIIFPVIGYLGGISILGFGKPVPIDSSMLRHPRRDDILVALAGPFANFLLALLIYALARFTLPAGHELLGLASQFAVFSVFLGWFNLLPLPFLDGWPILKTLFPKIEELLPPHSPWWILGMLLLINLPPVRIALALGTKLTMLVIETILGRI